MEFHYANSAPGMPYNSIGSFVDFFGGLTYDHVNFIFAEAHPYAQVHILLSLNSHNYIFLITYLWSVYMHLYEHI